MTNEDSASPDEKPFRISPELASAIREIAEYMNTRPTLVCPFQEDTEAAQKLCRLLHGRVGGLFTLVVTQNRVRFLNLRKSENSIRLRIHRGFLHAPPPVLDALGDLLMNPKNGVPALVRDFIHHASRMYGAGSAPRLLRAVGRVHDLRPMFDRLNRECFGGQVNAGLTWGRRSSKKRVRTRRLGRFNRRARIISIHPVLNDIRVPKYYVRYILFHEMLHSLQPSEGKRFHDAAFRRAARTFPEYDRARRWQRNHLDLLGLRSPRPKGQGR